MYSKAIFFLLSAASIISEQSRNNCNIEQLTECYHVELPIATKEVSTGSSITLRCKQSNRFNLAYCQEGKLTILDNESCLCLTDENRVLKRNKRFFFLFPLVCWLFRCRRHRSRDRTPPVIQGCPSDQTVYATPLQRHAFVNWNPPTAWDSKDGNVGVSIQGPYRPGGIFFEHDDGSPTVVGYLARDRSGNVATCNFRIYVKVKRCFARTRSISDGYRQCNPSSDMRLGTVCHYGCYQGHTLEGGPSVIECIDTIGDQAKWSNQQEPYCKKIECSPIVTGGQLNYSCTANFFYRSICTFACDDGYDIPKVQRRTKVCLASGTWDGYDPDCIDVDPPSLQQCPNTLMFYPGDNEDTAQITWEQPTVIDNKDKGLRASQTSGPAPASIQGVNTYTVTYGATDVTGNEAKECQFNVVVTQLRCHKLYPLPYMKLNCTGTRRGSECSFSCKENSFLVGKSSTFCQRNGEVPYAEWVMDFQPYCEVSNGCPDLIPPANGALSCDVWAGGRFCHPLCAEGFSVYYGRPLPNMLVCQDDGTWTKQDRLSDCYNTTSSRRRFTTMSAEFYFSGDCRDEDTQLQIKQKFIEAVENSDSFLVKKMCTAPECNVGMVKVICRSSSKRSTGNLDIYADIYFLSEDSILTSQKYELEVFTLTELVSSLEDEFQSSNISVSVNGHNAQFLDIFAESLELECPDNAVPVFNNVISCVECPPGTYYDVNERNCIKCSRGTYQSQAAKSSCLACFYFQTTGRIGATSQHECEDACEPGTWSLNGLPPCVDCDIGYYESNYGSTVCTQCPGNTITLTERNENVSACVDYDIVFPNSTDSYTTLELKEVELIVPFVISLHVICKDDCSGSILAMIMSTGNTIELTTSTFVLNELETGIPLKNDIAKKWNHIEIHISASKSSIFMDGQVQDIFNTGLELVNQQQDINITLGGNGFIGTLSQLMIVLQGDYNEHHDKFSLCQGNEVPGAILNWNAFAYSNLVNSYVSIPSRCDDFDNCQSNPCVNGNCTDELSGFRCSCDVGFTGPTCDVNIDDCVSHSCQNNATCVDDVNDYVCACEKDLTGRLCEIATVDGSWSNWDNWTECSVTCGNGTMRRARACSDPSPDNGGKPCEGEDVGVEECNLEPCKECEILVEPPNSTLSCETIDNTTVCTLECQEGYDFDHDAKDQFVCGNETYYYWDFQTNDNPLVRLPYCIERATANNMHVKHTAKYKTAGCDSESTAEIQNIIRSKMKSAVSQLTCFTSNICTLSEIEVINCAGLRTKRDTTTHIGLNIRLSCNVLDHATDTCFYGLEDAVLELNSLEETGEFDFDHNTKEYRIVRNVSKSDLELDCPIGSIPNLAFCVPCSFGHYYLSNECHSCPRGSYQSDIGEVFCSRCPEGWTTEGTDSVSIDDCSVPSSVPLEEKKDVSIVIGVCVGVPMTAVIIVVLVSVFRTKMSDKSKDKKMGKSCGDRNRKQKFDPRTLRRKNDYVNKCFDFDDVPMEVGSSSSLNFTYTGNRKTDAFQSESSS